MPTFFSVKARRRTSPFTPKAPPMAPTRIMPFLSGALALKAGTGWGSPTNSGSLTGFGAASGFGALRIGVGAVSRVTGCARPAATASGLAGGGFANAAATGASFGGFGALTAFSFTGFGASAGFSTATLAFAALGSAFAGSGFLPLADLASAIGAAFAFGSALPFATGAGFIGAVGLASIFFGFSAAFGATFAGLAGGAA